MAGWLTEALALERGELEPSFRVGPQRDLVRVRARARARARVRVGVGVSSFYLLLLTATYCYLLTPAFPAASRATCSSRLRTTACKPRCRSRAARSSASAALSRPPRTLTPPEALPRERVTHLGLGEGEGQCQGQGEGQCQCQGQGEGEGEGEGEGQGEGQGQGPG